MAAFYLGLFFSMCGIGCALGVAYNTIKYRCFAWPSIPHHYMFIAIALVTFPTAIYYFGFIALASTVWTDWAQTYDESWGKATGQVVFYTIPLLIGFEIGGPVSLSTFGPNDKRHSDDGCSDKDESTC